MQGGHNKNGLTFTESTAIFSSGSFAAQFPCVKAYCRV